MARVQYRARVAAGVDTTPAAGGVTANCEIVNARLGDSGTRRRVRLGVDGSASDESTVTQDAFLVRRLR